MTSAEIKKAIELLYTDIGQDEDVKERLESVRRLGLVLHQMPDDPVPLAGELPSFGAAFQNFSVTSCDTGFTQQVLIPTSVLANCMKDVLANPAQGAMNNFKRAYEMYNPAILSYTLLGYLGQDFTNPIKIAMEKNPSKETFENWAHIVTNVLTSLIHMEALANGLSNEKDEFNFQLLGEKLNLLGTSIDQWRKEYGF